MKKGYNRTIKQGTVSLLQSDDLWFLDWQSKQDNRQYPNNKEVKGLFKLVKISPNKKSLNLTVFFPIGKKFLIKTLIIPFLNP